MYTRSIRRLIVILTAAWLSPLAALAQQPPAPDAASGLPAASATPAASGTLVAPSVMYKVQAPTERLEMIVHTSRILTTEKKILQVQVGNSDVLELVTLSPNQIQISTKVAGVTQVNLWDENKKLFTIDVLVLGDVRQLEMMLKAAFPEAALKVVPVANAVMISGFVDKNEHIDRIIQIAEQYYPKVINGMTVGGVQQVLLHVKVMEVSRTKLRQFGFDWSKVTGGNIVTSGPTGLLADANPSELTSPANLFRTASPSTFAFNIGSGSNAFFGVLDALRQDNLMKIMSEPTLVTVSGRAASFNSGGKIPVPTPQSLGTLSIDWQSYGTQIEFVPIVLGNGKIRLEVKPMISELDYSTSTTIQGTTVPGIKSRDANTAVELMAGQTLAIAGLVQTRLEAQNAGLPWIGDLPYLGAAFRNVNEQRNEVELLILVTPELVDPLDACEVPPCGPGMETTSPSDWELYMKGHIEVPKCPKGNCGDCNGNGANAGDCGNPPPDGMIGSPAETVPSPQPSDTARRPARNAAASNAGPNNRYSPAKTNDSGAGSPREARNGPPGFIGPVGYDVVK